MVNGLFVVKKKEKSRFVAVGLMLALVAHDANAVLDARSAQTDVFG